MATKPGRWAISSGNVDPRFQHLWRDLAAAWVFWEGSGMPFDVVRRQLPASQADATWASDHYGLALDYGATGFTSIQTSGVPIAAGNPEFTILGVAETTAGDITGGRTLYGERPDATSICKLDGRDGSGGTGEAIFTLRDASNNLLQARGTIQIADGEPHTMVGVLRGGTTGELWVDGALDATATNGSLDMTDWPTDTPIEIARDPDSTGAVWIGKIGLVLVWQRALTPDEIELVSRDPFGMLRPAPVVPVVAREIIRPNIPRRKPGRWAASAGTADPKVRHLWQGLEILVPLWEGTGVPHDVVSGLPFSLAGSQIAEIDWEPSQVGQGYKIPGWSTAGEDGYATLTEHPMDGRTTDEVTFLTIVAPVLYHGVTAGGQAFHNGLPGQSRGGLIGTSGSGNPLRFGHWDGSVSVRSAEMLLQAEGESPGDVVMLVGRWRKPGKVNGVCFVNGIPNRGGDSAAAVTNSFVWDDQFAFGDASITNARGFGGNFVIHAAWSRYLGDGEIALLQRDPFAMLRMADEVPIPLSILAQFLRPDADLDAGGWTVAPLWSKIDEVVPSDADFITET